MVGKNSEPPGKSEWNTAAIRDLLTVALDDEMFTVLCFDHFRPVHESFAAGMSKGQKIHRLMDYCVRHNRVAELLDKVKKANPSKYAEFASQLKRRLGSGPPTREEGGASYPNHLCWSNYGTF